VGASLACKEREEERGSGSHDVDSDEDGLEEDGRYTAEGFKATSWKVYIPRTKERIQRGGG
jgi:hypothetical protein